MILLFVSCFFPFIVSDNFYFFEPHPDHGYQRPQEFPPQLEVRSYQRPQWSEVFLWRSAEIDVKDVTSESSMNLKLFYKQNRSWLCWLAGRISVNGRKQSVWQSVRPNWAPLDGQWMITRGRWSSNQFRFGGRFMNFVRHTVKDQSFYEPQPPFPSSPPGLCPSKPAPWLSIALGCFLGCCGTTGLHGNKIMTSLLPSCCRQPGVWPSTATARHWRCTNTSQWEQLSGQMTHRKKYQNFYCPKFF